MPRDGSGTYSLPAAYPFVTGTTIDSSDMNSVLSDVADALTQSESRDGQAAATAAANMGSYRVTNMGDATARTDAITLKQVQDGTPTYLTSVSGTNTITATAPFSYAAYGAGHKFSFITAGANTSAVTLNINGIGAVAVTKLGTTAMASGDWSAAQVVEVEHDGTRFQALGIAPAVPGTYAPLASPVFTGNPTAPTPTVGDADTSIATTAFVDTSFAKKASPTFTGTPAAPTAAAATNTTQLATTAFVTTAVSNATTGKTISTWVNFNGTGTIAIRDSHNVSSLTDNGVADYSINYTSAITAGYAITGMGSSAASAGSTSGILATEYLSSSSSRSWATTTSCRLQFLNTSFTGSDAFSASVIIASN